MPKSHKPPYVTAKEIYAAYGEALCLAQSMETGMRIFYLLDKALPKTPPGKLPRLNFDDETPPDLNINSLGGFIFQFRKEMMEEGTVDIQTRATMRSLEQAVEDRNWLVHFFWWEHLEEISSPQGRVQMLAVLRVLIEKFKVYDDLIRRLVLVYFSQYHLDPRQVESTRFQAYVGG